MTSIRLTPEVWPVIEGGQAGETQDAVLIYQPADPNESRFSGSLLVIASGLGGPGGQAAAHYVARRVMQIYFTDNEPDLGVRLRAAIEAANADLLAASAQRPELVKSGVSLAAAAVRGELLTAAWVGNNRIYLIRGEAAHQVTRDHTVVQQLLDEGAIKPEEAADHPRRDVVLRSLGTQENVAVELMDVRLRPDDALVLTSPGLTRTLDDEEIAAIVASKSPRNAAELLAQKARAGRKKPDVAVVAALLREGAPPLVTGIPYTWDGQRPSLDDQSTMSVSRKELFGGEEPPVPPQATAPSVTDRMSAAMQTQQGVPTYSGTSEPTIPAAPPPAQPQTPPPAPSQPAPAYQTPVQPAPPYSAPPTQPYYPPAPAAPPAYPPQQAQPYPPQQPQPVPVYGAGQGAPPGYAVDPVTGLPPIPQGQSGYGQPPGGGYAPRVYQTPGMPRMSSARRGPSMGTFAAFGALAVLIVAVMVLVAINPFNWSLPQIGAAAQAATATPTAEAITQPAAETVLPQVTPTEPPPPTQAAPPGMVLIDGGVFLRGVGDEEVNSMVLSCIDEAEDNSICYREYFEDAGPVEEVTLSPFYIDVTEVTNQAYAECVTANACTPPLNRAFYGDLNFAGHPVVYVSYNQAVAYCDWAGKRLPTEAEWEKAARWDANAGVSYIFPWGNVFEIGRANTASAGLGGTSEVTAFAQDRSPYGVLGMSGNVSEWVADWYYPDYVGLGTLNPTGPQNSPLSDPVRVARGGSFYDVAAYARAGHRLAVRPNQASDWLGFRCVADVEGATPPAPPTATPTPTGATPTGSETPPTAATPGTETPGAPTQTPVP